MQNESVVGHAFQTHSVTTRHYIHIYSANCNYSKWSGGGEEIDSCWPGFKVEIKIKKERNIPNINIKITII
jgi:hypothetical protein